MRYHEDQMTLEQAFRHTKKARNVAKPNLGFLKQLAKYEKKLRNGNEECCSPWLDHTQNEITKQMPEFVIKDFIEEYEIEFEVKHDEEEENYHTFLINELHFQPKPDKFGR